VARDPLKSSGFSIPARLAETCGKRAEWARWLHTLPGIVRDLAARWSFTPGEPFASEVSCSWVAPVTLRDGTSAVLKVGMPHFEGEHEIDAMLFWNGDPGALVY